MAMPKDVRCRTRPPVDSLRSARLPGTVTIPACGAASETDNRAIYLFEQKQPKRKSRTVFFFNLLARCRVSSETGNDPADHVRTIVKLTIPQLGGAYDATRLCCSV